MIDKKKKSPLQIPLYYKIKLEKNRYHPRVNITINMKMIVSKEKRVVLKIK